MALTGKHSYLDYFVKTLKISHTIIFKLVEFENGFLYSGLLLLLILKAESFLISYPYQIFCVMLLASTFLFVSFPKRNSENENSFSSRKARKHHPPKF
ncbi:hypothetical protein DSO57_1023748 [Entomophthora muscae]|uniref:Uncharacterized protein n=1 Tax=Entomophthora muscae TaxID=34485 RepID=A0ACC2S4M6_9FUNG|nr:hypothetical protein DSO57_1023748 [Entomophthora muscae]